MRTVSRLARISLLCAVGFCGAPASDAVAQDASGRPTTGAQDPSGRPRIRKTGKPKKVIRARPAADTEKVPTASVIIRSYPPVAEVYLDGQLVGTTADDGELELSDIRLGQHRVVLKKDGFREWAQTVTLTSPGEVEVEPLLQSENTYVRDVAKLTNVEFGRDVTGQVTRDSVASRDGKTFYNEYAVQMTAADALVVVLTTRSASTPTLRLVDDREVPYSIESLGDGVYQSVVVPRAGVYFLQVLAPLDASSFTSGEYTFRALEERFARGERPVKVGDVVTGALEASDRRAGPGDFFDSYSLSGSPGSRVRIAAAASNGAFTPGLTVMLDGKVVASSAKADDKGKKKKKNAPEPAGGGAEVTTTLSGGTYTIYVRSVGGAKVGGYELSVTPGG